MSGEMPHLPASSSSLCRARPTAASVGKLANAFVPHLPLSVIYSRWTGLCGRRIFDIFSEFCPGAVTEKRPLLPPLTAPSSETHPDWAPAAK